MMIRCLGFSSGWISVIMRCVEAVSYSFLVNGKPTKVVVPKRGLRQGDPISPYLFLLCVEGISELVMKKEREGALNGIRLCPGAPRIHHLLFADHSYIFAKATEEECRCLLSVLKSYEMASGQVVNLQKSSVVYSKNVKEDMRQHLTEVLGVQQAEAHDRYLGLPTFVGRNKTQTFAFLKQKLATKLQGWKSKLLSGGGREVLIKVIAQSLPVYSMNCFLLPKSLCNSLNRMC